MDHTHFGNTGLSVVGLGCGDNSRLGRGASFDECVGAAANAYDRAD